MAEYATKHVGETDMQNNKPYLKKSEPLNCKMHSSGRQAVTVTHVTP
jgi:hypothetical protein